MFLDDERYPHHVTWIDIPRQQYVIVRNYDQFVKYI